MRPMAALSVVIINPKVFFLPRHPRAEKIFSIRSSQVSSYSQ
jgi:hypothetical protein